MNDLLFILQFDIASWVDKKILWQVGFNRKKFARKCVGMNMQGSQALPMNMLSE